MKPSLKQYLCETELDEIAATWGPARRRKAADKLERWAGQLRSSADLLERCEAQSDLLLLKEDRDALQEVRVNVGCVSAEEAKGMAQSLYEQAQQYQRAAFLLAYCPTCPEVLQWKAEGSGGNRVLN
jgi:hypothetical protein